MINNFSAEAAPDKKAEFEILVKANMKRAYFTALGILGSHDAAMEISQEAFIRAYKNFSKFDRNRKFFTWYYKILKNLCLNFLRDEKRNKTDLFIEANELSLDPKEEYERSELSLKVNEALMELSVNEREIIILKEFEGLSYKEIAEALELPAGSVMSRLFYARKKLGEVLKRKL